MLVSYHEKTCVKQLHRSETSWIKWWIPHLIDTVEARTPGTTSETHSGLTQNMKEDLKNWLYCGNGSTSKFTSTFFNHIPADNKVSGCRFKFFLFRKQLCYDWCLCADEVSLCITFLGYFRMSCFIDFFTTTVVHVVIISGIISHHGSV